MTVGEAVALYALNSEPIDVDVFFDNGEIGYLGLVYTYHEKRNVNQDELERFAKCEVLRTESMVDDDKSICFDLYVSRADFDKEKCE